MFSQKDIEQIKRRGSSTETVEHQLKHFVNGFPYIRLVKPAVINDGILKFDKVEIDSLVNTYETDSIKRETLKFVPASGAATRMFKDLYAFKEKYASRTYSDDVPDKEQSAVYYLMKHIKNLACYNDLTEIMHKNNLDINECISKGNYVTVIDFLLSEQGLNYAQLPKGLLKFHQYENLSRTSIEEHLVEGVNYASKPDRSVEVHFTISPEHKEKIIKHISEVMTIYEKMFEVEFKVTYSEQKASTDTIAVNIDNLPFREADGKLVFRPGGHGALIENLNDLNADIVFIKNIDNVVPDRLKDVTYRFKKLLGGYLLKTQQQVFEYLSQIDNGGVNQEILSRIVSFARESLMIDFATEFEALSLNKKIEFLRNKLNRPIRVCGMVKNEGEPGGGPFWVRNNDGMNSLQIVESSQINFNDVNQKNIFNASTHFNPVDIVCSLRDYKGNNFNLLDFVDPDTGFVSVKSKDGKELKALELPGLWNGAMAHWITIFIEVPIETFNPVKTINDLLRKEHLK